MAAYDLPDSFNVTSEMRSLRNATIANLKRGYIILIQPVPPKIRVGRSSAYRGSCSSYICRKNFKTAETRASVESQLHLLEPCSDHKPPVLEDEVRDIGLTTRSPRLFHLQCLHELLSYDHGIGVCAFAERIYPEPRGNLLGPRGSWQPTKAEQFIIETWKAVQFNINSQRPSSVITRGTVPSIVSLEGHNYQLRAGPNNTIFQTKEAFDMYSEIATLNIPVGFQATLMAGRPLHRFLQDKVSKKGLQETIDAAHQGGPRPTQAPLLSLQQQEIESQCRQKYTRWMNAQQLAFQGSNSYYCQDKSSKEEKDNSIALKLAHWDAGFELSQWLPSSLNEAERKAALRRERYGIFSGMNLEKIGEEGPFMGVVAEEDMGEEIGDEAYEDDEGAEASGIEDEEAASGEKAASGNAEEEAAKVPVSGLPEEKKPKRKGKGKEKAQKKAEGDKKRKGSSEEEKEIQEKNEESPRTTKRRKEKNEEQSAKEEEEPAASKPEKEKGEDNHKDHEEEQPSSKPEKAN